MGSENSPSLLVESSSSRCFGGLQKVYSHYSTTVGCRMTFAIYLPPEVGKRRPVVFFLLGLTSSEQTLITKTGFQRYATDRGVIVVAPDTSPRGCNIPGESDRWDFGVAASFYVNATQEPWNSNWKMASYVTKELPDLIHGHFPTLGPSKQSISGYSMGGHGALVLALQNPGLYQSVSAFAPIANPVMSSWGQRAFRGYLGDNVDCWKKWDATELAPRYAGPPLSILIDQGEDDQYLKDELLTANFVSAASSNDLLSVKMRLQKAYDHTTYFVSTFIGDHLKFHANFLCNDE